MIDSEEAGKALRDIEVVRERSALAHGYREASPHLLVWGAIWTLGYGLPAAGLVGHGIWPWLVIPGTVASFLLARPSRDRAPGRPGRFDWHYAASVFGILAFLVAVASVIAPLSGRQIGTLIPLLVSIAYIQLGIWSSGYRIALVGLVVAAAALAAFHGLAAQFDLVMALTGGGGLILGGLWLRRL